MCKYKLDRQIAAQSRAFFDGLSDLIDPKWLRMFDPSELQELIGGEEKPIDVDDLRANSTESGFMNSETTRLFWGVVKGFNQDQRRALVQFVTSCGRPPLCVTILILAVRVCVRC
jgi:ubiquitin-protein ligase E3 C